MTTGFTFTLPAINAEVTFCEPENRAMHSKVCTAMVKREEICMAVPQNSAKSFGAAAACRVVYIKCTTHGAVVRRGTAIWSEARDAEGPARHSARRAAARHGQPAIRHETR